MRKFIKNYFLALHVIPGNNYFLLGVIRISIEDWLVSFLLLGSKLVILYYDIINFKNNYLVLFFLADIVVLYLLKSKGDKKKAFVLIFIYSLYGCLGLINIYFIIDKININQLILQLVDISIAFYLLYTSFRVYKSVSKGDKIIKKCGMMLKKKITLQH